MLEYIEHQKERKIPIKFHKVCPYSSNTIKNQICKQEKGLSIVSFFEEDDNLTKVIKYDVNKQLNELNIDFVHTERLHCTLLGVPSSKEQFIEKSNKYFDDIREKIKEFFRQKKDNGYHTTFNLKFEEVRPGTWHDNNNNQISNAGNGTGVAIGNPNSAENKKFVNLAEELIFYLKIQLSQIFNDNLERKFPTIWSTLGYFFHHDFIIDQRFSNLFARWKQSDHFVITINKLELVEYGFKDLSDAKSLEIFEF